jgi:hypothetical protein
MPIGISIKDELEKGEAVIRKGIAILNISNQGFG